jgi:hypothetical protein
MSKPEMLTVPLTRSQRLFVKRVARAQSTSEAAVVRRMIAEAARAVVEEARQVPALPSRPPPTTFPVHQPVEWTPEAIAAAEVRLERIEREQRGRWLDHAKFLRDEIALAKRMST